jgi:hypothetical protein
LILIHLFISLHQVKKAMADPKGPAMRPIETDTHYIVRVSRDVTALERLSDGYQCNNNSPFCVTNVGESKYSSDEFTKLSHGAFFVRHSVVFDATGAVHRGTATVAPPDNA